MFDNKESNEVMELMENGKVDILVATYNGQKYLETLLDSLLAQTYKNINIIISDDKSSDNTVEIIERYSCLNNNISYTINTCNQGYNKNFEKLVCMSKAEFFMFADQDDIWNIDKVEISLCALKQNNVDMVFTDLEVVDENLRSIYQSFNSAMELQPNKITAIEDLVVKNYATGCTMICSSNLKKYIIPFINFCEPNYIYDWYILIIAVTYGGCFYLDVPTLLYRQHNDNVLGYNKKRKSILQQIFIARRKRCEFIQTRINLFGQVNEKTKGNGEEILKYFESLKSTKYLNFRIYNFIKYFKNERWRRKMKYFFLLHIPLLFLPVGEKVKNKIK